MRYWIESKSEFALLRTAGDWEERDEMVRGRSLETRASSLESSQRASLVSIRSSISSSSPSDLEASDEDDEPSISIRPRFCIFDSISISSLLPGFLSSMLFPQSSSLSCRTREEEWGKTVSYKKACNFNGPRYRRAQYLIRRKLPVGSLDWGSQ